MMFNRNAFDNSRPDGMPVLEVYEKDEKEPGPRRFVPLVRSDLSGEVLGSLASLKLVQVFRYSREQMGTDLNLSPFEAAYRFPLPGDAAIRGVTVRFGEVEIEAVLREREQAEEEYREAKEKGQQAALLSRESPNVFTLLVAGLQPGEETTVTTQFVQLARADGSGWSLRIPLTTAPRYVRSDELDSRAAQGQPLALLRDPGHRFSLDLQFPAMTSVQSDTHALALSIEENGVRVQLEGGEVLPDRDCLLSWQPPQEKARPNLQAFLQTDPSDPFSYFLAFVVPPADSIERAPVPREVILLVDHSGSMEGPKWEAADWAASKFLAGLTPMDCFALGLFHNTTAWLDAKPLPATEFQVKEAVRFLQTHRDSGGTELGVALEQALSLPRDEVQRSRHVLLITDAEVSDNARILRLAEEEGKRADRRRISVLTIDAAPNAYLAQELAEKGGGIARFLTSNPEEEDIATALDEVLADWSRPLYADVTLALDRPGLETAGRVAHNEKSESWVDLGDLPAGRTLALSGRFPQGHGPLRLVLRAGREELARMELVEQTGAHSHPALPALFGARRVLALENLAGSGLPPEELADQLSRLGY
ncbi:MAG: VIT and VWA domain-containing protein, partial [Coprothermobacterota bacterium]|nr:VIT and VWA domain-containing protein [Coprothermobacterota bacterium]